MAKRRDSLSRQERLREVIEEISSELELRPLLTNIVRHACELLEAQDGSIGLYDESRDLFRTEAVYRMPDEELGAEMPPGVGLAGEVLRRRKPVILERYGSLAEPTLPELSEHAVIGMPIFWRDGIIAFFGIGAEPGHSFNEQDLADLSLFGRHAAIAIVNARRYQLEQRRAEQLNLLARVGRIITSGLELEEMLQNAADAIHRLLGFENVAIPLLEEGEPPELVLRAVGGTYRSQLEKPQYRLSLDQGIMGAAARERKTIRVNDVERDPRYVPTPAPSAAAIRAELAVPIMLGDQLLGVLNVESPEPLSDSDAINLEITADHLAVAIQNASLYGGARRLAVLEERQRLARDLHDSVTQMLYSATLIAQSVSPAYRRDPEEGERRLARLLELNRSALAEMRALLRELRPAEEEPEPVNSGEFPLPAVFRVRRDGLVSVMSEHLAQLKQDGLEVTWEHEGYDRQSQDLEEALFWISQEALHNTVKHARARSIRVRLETDLAGVRLVVQDDGSGFDARRAMARAHSPPKQDGGMGIPAMRERVATLRGKFRLESGPGQGTRLEVVLPRLGERLGYQKGNP